MKTKKNVFIAITQILVMLCIVLNPVNTSADESIDLNNDKSIRIQDVSNDFVEKYLDGANFNESTRLYLVNATTSVTEKEIANISLCEEPLATAIMARTIEKENTVRDDVFLLYNEKASLISPTMEMLTASTVPGSDSGNYTEPAFTIVGSMSYNIVYINSYAYFQQVSVSFNYTPKNNFVAGNFDVTASYVILGVEKSISDINSYINSTYSNILSVHKTNPQAHTIYRNSMIVDSSRVVDIWSGLYQGMWVNVNGTYRGAPFSATVANR